MREKSTRRILMKVAATLAAITAAFSAVSMKANGISENDLYESYSEIKDESVIDISIDEYLDLLEMTMSESGYCSSDLQNGCASVAVNRCIKNDCSMEDTLYEPGAFGKGNGNFYFRDSKGKWRAVEREDIADSVVEAVNEALCGEDVTDGAIGFYAPKYCSDKTKKYLESHTDDTIEIDGVVFYREWK